MNSLELVVSPRAQMRKHLCQQHRWRSAIALFITLFCAGRLLAVVPLPPGASTNAGPLLDWWAFGDTNAWSTGLGYPAVSYTNLSAIPLVGGNAVMVDDPSNAAWLQYNVWESDGTTNLTVDTGSVMFWFSPDWASQNQGGNGPQVAGRLIETGAFTSNASYGWWSLYLDAPGSNIYFSAQNATGSQSNYLSAPISWASNQFHLVALNYSSSNSALYLDGALATNGPGVTLYPSPAVRSNGFWMGSDETGLSQAHGLIGNVSTYNTPLDSNAIAATYALDSIWFLLNPLADNIAQAPSTPQVSPTFSAITGPGYLVTVSSNTGCGTSSNVWITNPTATVTTNGVNLTFTIAGGSNGLPYDIFATPALTQPLTNGIWTWMGQGYQCCTYTIPNLTNTAVFLILGTPQDSDGDGLTDAYELLVSHTNPFNSDTSGDGMLDGWKVLWGMNPMINNSAQASQRANYTYDGTGRLEANSGVSFSGFSPEAFTFDAEGNITLYQP